MYISVYLSVYLSISLLVYFSASVPLSFLLFLFICFLLPLSLSSSSSALRSLSLGTDPQLQASSVPRRRCAFYSGSASLCHFRLNLRCTIGSRNGTRVSGAFSCCVYLIYVLFLEHARLFVDLYAHMQKGVSLFFYLFLCIVRRASSHLSPFSLTSLHFSWISFRNVFRMLQQI